MRTTTLLWPLVLPVSGCGVGTEQSVPYSCTEAATDDATSTITVEVLGPAQ